MAETARFLCSLRRGWRFVSLPFVAGALWVTVGCGGGGGGGGNQPIAPTLDFSLSVSSSSLAIVAGGSATVSVTVTGFNGFTSPVMVGITGLPSGVSVSPASVEVSPGKSEQLTFTAAAYLSSSITGLTITGSSSSPDYRSHTAKISLAVSPYAGSISLPRTRYTRTDAATPYFLWPNSNWILYDSTTNRFFVTDPSTNQVMVLDAATRTEIGTIKVPGAFGIDETPDHTTLYAGTQIGDVYAIDPVGMKVVHRYIESQIGPSGYKAYSVRVLANGNLALLGGQGGIPGVDGYAGFAVWNPTDNSISTFGGTLALPCGQLAGGISEFSVTGDRSLVLLVVGNGNRVCTINPATGAANSYVSGAGVGGYPVASTPDGKSILALQWGIVGTGNSPPQIVVLDATTLAQKSTITLSADSTSTSAIITSTDSKTVYVSEDSWTGIVYAYDIASGTYLGWLSNLFVSPITGGLASGPIGTPDFQAVDNTGLLAGPMEEGVGFLDTSALQTGPVGSDVLNGYLSPATGPSAGGTTILFYPYSDLDTVYFGANKAAQTQPLAGDQFTTVTPTGTPGQVDVSLIYTDGALQILPDAFSYGPTILEGAPNSSTADGGGTGIIYGYGLGPTDSNTLPTGLQVEIGGKQAQITSYSANAYGVEASPFPLQSVSYTIPAGVSGGPAGITVTTQAGSATLSGGMSYLPATQQFPLSGAVLIQGIYDGTRDLYYFTDAAEIRVFSKTQDQWLTPIQVPSAPTGTTHRLWGIALSPDGSKLAVADSGAGIIYVIDPVSTTLIKSFPVVFTGSGWAGLATSNPFGLAISDSGFVYFAAVGPNSSGYLMLDTSSGLVTANGIPGYEISPNSRTAISSDNSTVFFNDDGLVLSIDTATGEISYATDDPGCCYGDYDLTLSADQTTLEATSYLYDTNLNAASYLALNDRETLNITYVYGTKLSPDGSLLFQPSTNGIDIFDGRLGTLRSRIALPFALSQNFDALVGDGQDNTLIAITGVNGDGIAIIDLSSLREPSPLPYLKKHAVMAHMPGLNERTSFGAVPVNRTEGKAAPPIEPRLVIKHASNERLARRQ